MTYDSLLFGLWLKTSYSAIFIQNLRYKTNVLVGKATVFSLKESAV